MKSEAKMNAKHLLLTFFFFMVYLEKSQNFASSSFAIPVNFLHS